MILTRSRDAQPTNENACSAVACRFCGLRRGEKDLFMELHGDVPHLPIPGVPDSLMVMLCAFPLGHRGGHLLIAPKQHYPSLARFTRQEELRRVTENVADLLQRMFPAHWLFAFEHGPGELANRPVKCGGCHVDHAHGHVLVLDPAIRFDDIRELTEEVLEGLGWDLAAQTHEGETPFVDIAAFCGERPYLHIGRLGPAGKAVTYRQDAEDQSIPSQLLRRLVAAAAGRPSPSYWNWKIALQHNLRTRLNQYAQAALGFKRIVREFVASTKPSRDR